MGCTALWHCAHEISQNKRIAIRNKYIATARILLESGADPDRLDHEGRLPRNLVLDVRTLAKERHHAVNTAAFAFSLMSGLCGEHSGTLLASFLATPWMLKQIQSNKLCKPWWVNFGARLRERHGPQN